MLICFCICCLGSSIGTSEEGREGPEVRWGVFCFFRGFGSEGGGGWSSFFFFEYCLDRGWDVRGGYEGDAWMMRIVN